MEQIEIMLVDADENNCIGLTLEQLQALATGKPYILRVRVEGYEEVTELNIMSEPFYRSYVIFQITAHTQSIARLEFLRKELPTAEYFIRREIERVVGAIPPTDTTARYGIISSVSEGALRINVYGDTLFSKHEEINWPKIANCALLVKPFNDGGGVSLIYTLQPPTPPDC